MVKRASIFLVLFFCFGYVFGGWHPASSITSGDFPGNYNFTSDINFKSNVYISSQTSCGKLYTDSSGNVLCGSDANSGGDITSVTAGNQLTGGGTSGDVTLDLSEGSGSGLDADMVDGQHASAFLTDSDYVENGGSIGKFAVNTNELNTLTTAGIYWLTNNAATDKPTSRYSHLIVYGSGNYLYQEIRDRYDMREWFIRYTTDGGSSWSNWYRPVIQQNEDLHISDSGNIGIGTTTPNAQLEIDGTSRVTSANSPTAGSGLETFYNANENRGRIIVYDRDSSSYQDFYINNLGDFTVKSNGKVGIGTTNPASQLEIAGDGSVGSDGQTALRLDGSWGGGIALEDDTKQGTIWVQEAGTKMMFSVGTDIGNSARTNEMTIDNNGNVGIGTSSPTSKLDVHMGNLRVKRSSSQFLELQDYDASGAFVRANSAENNKKHLKLIMFTIVVVRLQGINILCLELDLLLVLLNI